MNGFLVANWKDLATKSLTHWFVYIGMAAELLLNYGMGIELPWWAHLTLLVFIGGGRLINQNIGGTASDAPK